MGDGLQMNDCMEAVTNASDAVVCVGKDGLMIPSRYQDFATIGQSVNGSECSILAKSVREGAICSRRDNSYFISRVTDGAILGDLGDTLDECLQALKASNQKVVCAANEGGYTPTRVIDRARLGKPMQRRSCSASTAVILRSLVCTYEDGGYYPTRISDGKKLGLPKTLDDCIDNVRNGSNL
jgi:hypothetical protein